ncbi:hypothetical protein C8J57DRAFT_1238448 [Mycena rebaudengoi]|nr:hypothetical protein C8J57DRAFT_1238448 [Mycena rebaudengoi]
MERKDFVLTALLQLTRADIDDYKQWIGRMSSMQPDITPHSAATILPTSRNRLPSVEATKDEEVRSFHPPLPLNGPIFVEAHPCPTPIPAPVVVKSVLCDIINLAASAPAPQKRQRQEVDLKNVIDEPRARKVRKRES